MPFRLGNRRNVSAFLITDSFNRADSTTTMGSTDTGQTWLPNSGTWGITGNLAYLPSAAGGQNTTVVESSVSDCTVQLTLTTFDDCGACVRSTDDANNFICNNANLFKRVTGSFTSLGAFSSGFTDGNVQAVVLSGTSIIVKQNGTSVLSVTESFNQTATQHGLRANTAGTSAARFNDFSVTVP